MRTFLRTIFRTQAALFGAFALTSTATLPITDTNPPSILQASGSDTFTSITLRFSEPIAEAQATNPANYSVSGGVAVRAATLRDPATVVLITSQQTTGAVYTVTVRDIRDKAVPTPNLISPNPTTVSFNGFVLSRGFARHKFWENISPNTMDALRNDPRFPTNPTFTTFEPFLEYPPNAGGEAGSNYGNQLTALLLPPVSGDYVFYCSGDNEVEVYLSSDADPAQKILIAFEPMWNNARQWLSTERRPGAPDAPENRSFPIRLTAGQLYYIEVLHIENSAGDNVGVTWQLPGANPPTNGSPPIRGAYLAIYTDPGGAFVTITQQPRSTVITENTTATFTVGAQGSGGLGYQWQKAPLGGSFTNIPGANSDAYVTPPLPLSESGSRYRVLVSVTGASATSAEAIVTVESDRTAPTVLYARRSFNDRTKVKVAFSEPISATSGGTTSNFRINNGIDVLAAVVSPDPAIVELTTSAINAGTSNILTINGVQDLFTNTVATNTQILITFQKGIMLVVGNTQLNAGDTVVSNRLFARGFDVEIGTIDSKATNASARDLLMTSSTIGSADFANNPEFKDLAVPVLNWEQELQDDYRMTGDIAGTNRDTIVSQATLDLLDSSHPLAARFPAGTIRVVDGLQTFSWGSPTNSAARIATVTGDPGKVLIYGYEKAAPMFGGFLAPARRVEFFLTDDTAPNLTSDGWKLFDAAVDWALNVVSGGGQTNPPSDITITLTGTTVTVRFAGGALEEADQVTGPWRALNVASPYITSASGARKFYRLRRN